MTRRVVFDADAQADVEAAAEWYDGERTGLGERFLDELDRLVMRLCDNPLQFPEIEAGTRRGLLNRFPYGVYFSSDSDLVEVIAVLHLRRDPDAWKRRT